MKLNDRYTAGLMIKKSNTYLKNAILIFVLTIAVLGYGVLFLVNYVQENNRNFVDNDTVHVLYLTLKQENTSYQGVQEEDLEEIQDIILQYTEEYSLIPVYTFVGAITDGEDQDSVVVYGIDREYTALVFGEELEEGVFYVADRETIDTLLIPVVHQDQGGGLTSDTLNTFSLDRCQEIRMNTAFSAFRFVTSIKEVYLCRETFDEMFAMVGYTSNSLEEVYVYIDDMYLVEDCADALIDAGYVLDYTFKSFDSIGDSLKKSLIFVSILVAALLITSSLNVILSFFSFLRMQQKDIGILKFYGFSNRRIYRMYRRNINKIFGGCGIGLCAFVVIVGTLLISENRLPVIAVLVAAVALLIVLIRGLVLTLCLRKMINLDVLTLVRHSKNFE